MSIEIRVPSAHEVEPMRATLSAAFGSEPLVENAERWAKFERERLLCAVDDDAIVGTAGINSFTLSVPGGEVPAAGVTIVGVLPSHRRRGILTQLMRRQMDDVRALGEPVAILWASEADIYPRFGYGMATMGLAIDIAPEDAVLVDKSPAVGRTRLVSAAEAMKVLPEIYERVRIATPGMYARDETWWEWQTLWDGDTEREGGGPMFRAVWENEGSAGAYALYRVHSKWDDMGIPAGRVQIKEVIATSLLGTREIWRFLFGIDLVTRVKAWFEPVDSPLRWMLEEPRRLRATLHDGVWLRVVDVKAALESRSYRSDGSVTFDLDDSFCEWNRGSWRLESSGGGAGIEPYRGDADLAVDAQALGAVYLGGATFSELLRAGRITELQEGAARRADDLFRTEAAPWSPELF